MVLIDSNVILDLFTQDPRWLVWSGHQMRTLSQIHQLSINTIVFAELSPRFSTQDALEKNLESAKISILDLPREAAFLAGKVYAQYRKQGGSKENILANFFIGSHASVLGCPLLTRDKRNYTTYFPLLKLIAPLS
jgi:predicted nucleic acid-binding protein